MEAKKIFFSPKEYLELERKAEYKSEYFNGEIFAMSGASKNHNKIAANLTALIWNKLRNSKCKVYGSDMRVNISESGLLTYPDLTIVCEEEKFLDKEFDTLLNPTIIIEILSESTEKFDRGIKFEHYRKINSLKEYLLVSQTSPKIEQFIKQADGKWLYSESVGLNSIISIPTIEFELPLNDVFFNIDYN